MTLRSSQMGDLMRKLLLKAVFLGTMATFHVTAATAGDRDYGYREGPYLHEAAGNWTGLYIGAAIGYSYSSSDVTHDWTSALLQLAIDLTSAKMV